MTDEELIEAVAAEVKGTPMKILRKNEVAERLGVSIMTLWRWEKTGNFPGKIQLGSGSVGYLESEIDNWIETKAEQRDAGCHLWATIAVGNNDDCGDFPEMPAYVQEIYRKAARAVIPVAQAPLLARIAELEEALDCIADIETDWTSGADANLELARTIARNALRSTQ